MEVELGSEEHLEVENPDYRNLDVHEKEVDDRSLPGVFDRDTSFYEEWRALKTFYREFPSYFPEPFYAVRVEADSPLEPDPVISMGMEKMDVEGGIAEVSPASYDREGLFREAVDTVREFHSNRYTPPHGDLNGNTWVTGEGSVVFGDPKGQPRSIHERRRMREDDAAHLELMAKKLGVDSGWIVEKIEG